MPVVAGISYEVIRFAGNHRHSWFGRALAVPGNLVQSITTQEPDDSQIEVAVRRPAGDLRRPVRPDRGGPLMLAPPPRPLTRSGRKVILVAALVTVLVEIAGLMELLPRIDLGRLVISPSIFPAFFVVGSAGASSDGPVT